MGVHVISFPLCVSMLVILLLLNPESESAAAAQYVYTFCRNSSIDAPSSEFDSNLSMLLDSLSFDSLSLDSADNSYGFNSTSVGEGTKDEIYGLYLCQGDQDVRSCSNCVHAATLKLLGKDVCPNSKEAVIWFDECTVRYSNHSLSGRLDQDPTITLYNAPNITGNQTRFVEIVAEMLRNVSIKAADGGSNKKYATDVQSFSSFLNLYASAQCTPDLSAVDCKKCLTITIESLVMTIGGRSYLPSCNVRYDINRFFADVDHPVSSMGSATPVGEILCTSDLSQYQCNECVKKAMEQLQSGKDGSIQLPGCSVQYRQPSHNGTSNSSSTTTPTGSTSITRHATDATKKRKILGVSISIVISICIGICLIFGIQKHIHNMKAREFENSDIGEIRTMESLEFDLNTIKAATQNFSGDNKLGEGGFGEVYKGVLEGGEEIAVKRLSKTSGQGVTEFKTEVVLVAKLQHKNLVKLLGFCLESKEKILIYEYLQNSSLDKLLSDPTKKLSCDWQMRYKVIVGIARGLLYLHEDSRLKIIHRDLKPSNILLDDGMNPKISDFGLARLFGVDETQGDTKRIVGTYGYMAPEYVMTGHYSVKSDVYSFGIIVLEIVSGQKNRFFGRARLEEALLHRAWRLWNEKNILHLVDTTLNNLYPKEEVTKCIHIGLLCIQENAAERPRMANVVAAITGQSVSLPMPKAPNFFGDTSVSVNARTELARYGDPTNIREIEYHNVMQRNGEPPPLYSGSENITDLHPR